MSARCNAAPRPFVKPLVVTVDASGFVVKVVRR